jgi:hypothetical protein
MDQEPGNVGVTPSRFSFYRSVVMGLEHCIAVPLYRGTVAERHRRPLLQFVQAFCVICRAALVVDRTLLGPGVLTTFHAACASSQNAGAETLLASCSWPAGLRRPMNHRWSRSIGLVQPSPS